MVEGVNLKTQEKKKIAHRDLRRRFASFALSLGLLFTGSSGAIFARAEGRDKRREANKRRPEKDREDHKRLPEKEREAHKRRPERDSDTRKRGRGNSPSVTSKRDAESRGEARKRYEETRREATKRKREWIRDDDAKQSLFSRQLERRGRATFPTLPKNAKQSLFLQRPEAFKRKREWIREVRKQR